MNKLWLVKVIKLMVYLILILPILPLKIIVSLVYLAGGYYLAVHNWACKDEAFVFDKFCLEFLEFIWSNEADLIVKCKKF